MLCDLASLREIKNYRSINITIDKQKNNRSKLKKGNYL